MDVTVPISDLKRTLTVAKRVVAKRCALPALSGVRLTAAGDALVVEATDLDTTYTSVLAAEVREPGISIVGAADLAAVIKGQGRRVVLTTAEQMLKAVNGTTSTLRSLPVEEWPKAVDFTGAQRFPLDLTTVAEVAAAASRDEARPILTGVLFRKDHICATDSYRLHLATVDGAEFGWGSVGERRFRRGCDRGSRSSRPLRTPRRGARRRWDCRSGGSRRPTRRPGCGPGR